MGEKSLYFLHGFAGDSKDWDEVIKHLSQYQCMALSYPFQLPNEGILVGYSMGGRIAQAVETAVINKRGGGIGLISGRKAFQKPLKEGVELLHAIQDVYLAKEVTVA
jgi:hypothetical protein